MPRNPMTALFAASSTLPREGSLTDLVVELTVRTDAGVGSKRGVACRSRASERYVHMTGVVATGSRSPLASHRRYWTECSETFHARLAGSGVAPDPVAWNSVIAL